YLDSPVGEIRIVEEDTSGFEEGTAVGVSLTHSKGYVFDDETGVTLARTAASDAIAPDGAATDRSESASD
ncbi:MAG: hypothetical protein ABEJ82_01135, partial [Haloplanus sp.]